MAAILDEEDPKFVWPKNFHELCKEGQQRALESYLLRAPRAVWEAHCAQALALCILWNRRGCMRLLLASGADPDAPASGRAPLAICARRNAGDLVLDLAEAGAKVDLPGPGGRSALHVAARCGAALAARALVDCGADVCMPDAEGNTPCHEAAMGGHLELVEICGTGLSLRMENRAGKVPADCAAGQAAAHARGLLASIEDSAGLSGALLSPCAAGAGREDARGARSL